MGEIVIRANKEKVVELPEGMDFEPSRETAKYLKLDHLKGNKWKCKNTNSKAPITIRFESKI